MKKNRSSMALSVGIGKGKDRDPFEAGRTAARDVGVQMNNVTPHALLLFCASTLDHRKFIDGVRSVYPNTPMVGCTTAGHGTREEFLDEGGVLLGLSGKDPHHFVSAHTEGVHASEESASGKLLAAIKAQVPLGQLSALLVFSDGLAGSGISLLSGLCSDPAFRSIVGGFAGDGMAFHETVQFEGGGIFRDALVGLGISGISAGVAGEHGWKPIGVPMTATKAEGALLMELDGKPAFGIYEKYLGEAARELREEPMSRLALSYPLGIVEGETVLVRAPLSVDEQGGILCGAEIKPGSSVRLLLGSKEAMISAASRAGLRAKNALGGASPSVALVISSMTRRRILGADTMKEIHAVGDVLGANVPVLFLYGYGEFFPVAKGPSVFQNESIVVLTLG